MPSLSISSRCRRRVSSRNSAGRESQRAKCGAARRCDASWQRIRKRAFSLRYQPLVAFAVEHCGGAWRAGLGAVWACAMRAGAVGRMHAGPHAPRRSVVRRGRTEKHAVCAIHGAVRHQRHEEEHDHKVRGKPGADCAAHASEASRASAFCPSCIVYAGCLGRRRDARGSAHGTATCCEERACGQRQSARGRSSCKRARKGAAVQPGRRACSARSGAPTHRAARRRHRDHRHCLGAAARRRLHHKERLPPAAVPGVARRRQHRAAEQQQAAEQPHGAAAGRWQSRRGAAARARGRQARWRRARVRSAFYSGFLPPLAHPAPRRCALRRCKALLPRWLWGRSGATLAQRSLFAPPARAAGRSRRWRATEPAPPVRMRRCASSFARLALSPGLNAPLSCAHPTLNGALHASCSGAAAALPGASSRAALLPEAARALSVAATVRGHTLDVAASHVRARQLTPMHAARSQRSRFHTASSAFAASPEPHAAHADERQVSI